MNQSIQIVSTPRNTGKSFYSQLINSNRVVHESGSARSVTINYRDGSSYTIKTKGNVRVLNLNGKSERKLEIMYDREPVTVKSTDDFTVKEVGSVTESVTLRQKDVKSISVRELGRTTTLNKF